MRRARTASVLVSRFDGGSLTAQPDELVVEEPLEIRLDDHLVTTTMRTPGNDFELAAGFCFTDGLLGGATVRACRYCGTARGTPSATEFNVVNVDTGSRAPVPEPRLTTTTSSCGLCGSASLDALRCRLHPLLNPAKIGFDVLAGIPARVQPHQPLFSATGGLHAAAAFDPGGEPLLVREDIGRHNAIDKVVGRLLLDDQLPADGLGLYVSGRASFEIVQKAWASGFGTVVAVSAPSALAVETARVAGITLVGFVRDGRYNLYSPEGVSLH